LPKRWTWVVKPADVGLSYIFDVTVSNDVCLFFGGKKRLAVLFPRCGSLIEL
jgi:hypothetical protein